MEVKKILKYRSIWMGLAIIWAVWFHSELGHSQVIYFIRNIGFVTVDVFLFASGIGCYFSLSKDGDVLAFLKRRVRKLVPIYWVYLAFWIVFKKISIGLTVPDIIGNIFALEYFTGNDHAVNWYLSALLIFYMIVPVFVKIVDKMSNAKQLIAVVILLLICTVPFWDSELLIIISTRVPIFFIGVYFGKLGKNGATLSKKSVAALLAMIPVGIAILMFFIFNLSQYLWTHGLMWYTSILIAPGTCIIVSGIASKLDSFGWGEKINRFFSFIGRHTFEVYLVHLLIFDWYRYLVENGTVERNLLTFGLFIALIIPACAALFYLSRLALRLYDGAKLKLAHK